MMQRTFNLTVQHNNTLIADDIIKKTLEKDSKSDPTVVRQIKERMKYQKGSFDAIFDYSVDKIEYHINEFPKRYVINIDLY